METDARDVLARMYESLGISHWGLSLLVGREERSIGRYFHNGIIPATFGRWLCRIKSVRISEGEAIVTFRLPYRVTRRGFPIDAAYNSRGAKDKAVRA